MMLVFFSTLSNAQIAVNEVIATASDHASSEDVTISWTVGEAQVGLYSMDLHLNQGFHQTYSIITSVQEPPSGR